MKKIKTERRLSASLTTQDTCEFADPFVDLDDTDDAALVRLLRNKAFLVEMCETPTFRHQHEVYHKSHREFDLTERVTDLPLTQLETLVRGHVKLSRRVCHHLLTLKEILEQEREDGEVGATKIVNREYAPILLRLGALLDDAVRTKQFLVLRPTS